MGKASRKHLVEVGKIKKTEHSSEDDPKLAEIMQTLAQKIDCTWVKPAGYQVVWTPTWTFEKVKNYLSANGVKDEDVTYLLHSTKTGLKPSIHPDGGVISLVKTDAAGNILEQYILLASENKYQGSKKTKQTGNDGNAEQRLFKNLQFIKSGVYAEDILPYVIFGYGSAFVNENVLNSIRGGAMFEVNKLSIYRNSLTKVCPIMVREEKWRDYEISEILNNTIRQSMDYYTKKLGA